MGLPDRINPGEDQSRIYENIEYEDFWSGCQKGKLDELEHEIVDNLLPPSGMRIIDVGCGFGRLSNCYIGRYKQVIMVDPSTSLLRQAYQRIGNKASYIAADANHLPFHNATFDTCLMVRVFHHIKDSKQCLRELHRILGNQGKLVFSYSNKCNPAQVVKWILRKVEGNPFSLQPTGIGTTFITFHPRYVKEILDEMRFSDFEYLGAGVLDKFFSENVPWTKWKNIDAKFAPLLGNLKLAPWIFCGAIANNNDPLRTDDDLESLLQCPACNGNLRRTGQFYKCSSCATDYPISQEEGIIDFRIN
jgi:SAM-dependent methyltransferase